MAKRRIAVVGTGHRGTATWGRDLLKNCGEWVELVGLADSNPLRLARARDVIGRGTPTFAELGLMLAAVRPDTLIVCTRDSAHDDHIVEALEAGIDVLTEKPMATTAQKCRRILEAERRTGRRVDVAFNYRFAPTARRLKQLIIEGAIGAIASVDFHWYLDVIHGADYFRRWHARLENSGSLFVHKATHHFDLLNWYLDAEPREVFARGELRHYGRCGPFRGVRCKGCEHAERCDFRFDISRDAWLDMLYEEPSVADGYFRDACVFREDIDIPDTMTAALLYDNGVQVSYSLNTFMPIEGYHLALNGDRGRIEVRVFERQPWETEACDEIAVISNFGSRDIVRVPHGAGGHFGGDVALQMMLFGPEGSDPLNQRAGSRAGTMSVLCGAAAVDSIRRKKPIDVPSLLG
ncbi:MAG: Gfo/Idh/MocA family oxidoreductase [Methylobacteriaceae bacterium]|nr:Gfo/Idh/MocA family oxidoreductase [Methylobacteriaceae bacterium]